MAKTLEITKDERQAWALLGDLAGLYGDNGGEPDGNAWLPSQTVTEEEGADVIAAGLGEMVDVLYANDEAMGKVLKMAPLPDGEELEEETADMMKLLADEHTVAWAHYGAYGASDSLWVFIPR